MSVIRVGMGSFGDVVSDALSSTDADVQQALKMFHMYWNALKPLNPEIPTDFSAFLSGIKDALVPPSESAKWPGYVGPVYPDQDKVFMVKLAGIGNMLNVSGVPGFKLSDLWGGSSGTDLVPVSDSQIESAMNELARAGQGHIMANINQYGGAVLGQVSNPPFLDTLWYVVQATAATVAKGAEEIGQGVIDTGKSVLAYRNYILIGAVGLAALILYQRFVPRQR